MVKGEKGGLIEVYCIVMSREREGSRGKLWSSYDYAPEENLSVA